jgi:cellulose synthase/poly-beta-1,6-N-acetylglucosamine synthase-like glycosyltransferase/peptidoglycan/xylan/chitin deacetylase (PgdA/CDA1 family)/spore germination protein YaaH
MERLPIFYDPKQRRWRRIRLGGIIVGLTTLALVVVLAASVSLSPRLRDLDFSQRLPATALFQLPTLVHTSREKIDEEVKREAARQRADYQKAESGRKLAQAQSSALQFAAPVVVGFFVNWDGASFSSLKEHLSQIDILMPEWLHLGDTPGSVTLDNPSYQHMVTDYLREHNATLPIMPLVNNLYKGTWNSDRVHAMLADKVARAQVEQALLAYVEQNHFAGVSLDLENISDVDQANFTVFVEETCAAFHAAHLKVSVNVPADNTGFDYPRIAAASDYTILMMYDEHASVDQPGPISGIDWFTTMLAARAKEIPREKLIVALGNYAYDWQQGKETTEETFDEALLNAKESSTTPTTDPLSLSPTYSYYDEANALHEVWMQDATTAFNEYQVLGRTYPKGVALWRLGSEDLGLWNFLGSPFDSSGFSTSSTPSVLTSTFEKVSYGYNIDYEDSGEILQLTSLPQLGQRSVTYDNSRGLITSETYKTLPSPYVITRHGAVDHAIALTFDDGPDPRYTPTVLDILKAKHVPATFFIIGENAEQHPDILKRIFAEGHEIGNHTYTHPNVSDISEMQLRLELAATERLIESLLGRQTLLFRPPYADDIEPETPDQMLPLVVTHKLGYVVVGMGLDPNDWESPPAEKIVGDILSQADAGKGNVILLHDAGGTREQTIKALPLIIDALRAKGYRFVLASELAGKSRNDVMPIIPHATALAVAINSLSFGVLYFLAATLSFLFVAGIVLGILRFLFVGSLAIVEYRRQHKHTLSNIEIASRYLTSRLNLDISEAFLPPVAVIIAAYNEEKVILQTIRTLLASTYKGILEIIVVDDGSTDATYSVVQETFGSDKRVQLYTQPNAGKAAALNNGIGRTWADVVITLDADTIFTRDTVPLLVRHFGDRAVGAVAGNAKVGNRINLLTCFQALEYITSQNLDRRAFSVLNCITVVPGAVGAWRRSLVLALGGFTHDTLAEDTDLTMAIRKRGYKILYEDEAIGLTEAPDTVRDLIKQRYRWMFGTLQATWKHRDVLFRPRYGAFGFIAVPNVIIFQILFPLISPVMDLMVVISAITSAVSYVQHSEAFSPSSLLVISAYYGLFLVVDLLTSGLAFILERKEDPKLLVWLLLQRFCYRQIMYYVAIKAFVASLSGIVVGWNKLDRKATVLSSE